MATVISNVLGMLQENVQMLLNNYPEIMFKIFVVNGTFYDFPVM